MLDPKLLGKLLEAKKKMDGLKDANPEAFDGMKEDYDNLMNMLSRCGKEGGCQGITSEDAVVEADVSEDPEHEKMMATMVEVKKSGKDFGQGDKMDKVMEKMAGMTPEMKAKMMEMLKEKMKEKKGGAMSPDMAALYGM